MAFDSVPDLMQSFEAKIIDNFIEKLRIFVYPHKFDMQLQLALAFEEEQRIMAYWREVIISPRPVHHLSRRTTLFPTSLIQTSAIQSRVPPVILETNTDIMQ